MTFHVSSGKIMFLFPENMIFFFRQKMKDDLSPKKNAWKYDIFFKCSEKMVSLKKLHWNMIFLYIMIKDGISFSQKIWYLFTDGK